MKSWAQAFSIYCRYVPVIVGYAWICSILKSEQSVGGFVRSGTVTEGQTQLYLDNTSTDMEMKWQLNLAKAEGFTQGLHNSALTRPGLVVHSEEYILIMSVEVLSPP